MNEELMKALLAVQEKMPVIGKNKEGAHKAKYADMEKVWEVAMPIIRENGFVITHGGSGDTVTTTAWHEKGRLTSSINLSQQDPQKKGAEVTYYRRYNVLMIFDIVVADEDKDAQGTGETDKDALKVIKDSLDLLNTLDELGDYYKQLKNPKEKKILALFTARKKQLTQ